MNTECRLVSVALKASIIGREQSLFGAYAAPLSATFIFIRPHCPTRPAHTAPQGPIRPHMAPHGPTRPHTAPYFMYIASSYCPTQPHTALHFLSSLHCTTCYSKMHYNNPHCTTLPHTAPHCTIMPYTTPHCTALNCILLYPYGLTMYRS